MKHHNEKSTADKKKWVGDSGYHGRHKKRSIQRAKRIASHFAHAKKFLDVGCNQGLTTSYLLDAGKVAKATGVEIADDAVSSSLLSNPNFDLITGDISELDIQGEYDCIFYGAVHHHIVREKGLGVAVEVFQKLVKACNGIMFFETGQLTEGGRWLWQNKLKEYFSTDEEHIFYLLRAIEPCLVDFHVVGRFQIHGVWRYLFKLYISHNHDENYSFSDFDHSNIKIVRSFTRTSGSSYQRLIESESLISDTGVHLAEINLSDERFFLKTRFRTPHIDNEEFELGTQVDFDWALGPKYITDKGIIFPWIDGVKLNDYVFACESDRVRILTQINIIWSDITEKDITLFPSIFCPNRTEKAVCVFDFNVNNFIVVDDSVKLTVVDFEFHSSNSYSRNLMNFSKLYFFMGAYSLGIKFYAKGFLIEVHKLLKRQFNCFRVRVIQRGPSFSSFFVTIFRSQLGKILVKCFPFLAEK